MKRPRLMFIILLMMGIHLSLSLPVFACSGNFRQTTLQEIVDDAGLIFKGAVTGEEGEDPYTRIYTVHVETYLKGEGPSDVLMTGYGSGSGDCLNQVYVGQEVIFLADGDPVADKVLQASYLQVYDSLIEINEQNISDVSAAVGHAATPPYSTPVWTLIKYWTYSPVIKIAVLVGMPLLIVGGVFTIVASRRRPAKKKNDAVKHS